MKLRPIAAAFAVLFVIPLGSVALAADEKEQSANDDAEATVCKYAKLVNSRIPQRVCMKQHEWDAMEREQLENKRSNRNRNSSCTDGGRC